MNINEIESLAKIMETFGLTALEIAEGNLVIKLERASNTTVSVPSYPVMPATIPTVAYPEAAPLVAAVPHEEVASTETVVDFNHIFEVKSPMVGIFYAAPNPDAEPFVKIGSKVKKGDVLCIIEAMKLMNEITAENDGEIVDICVSSGQVVEYSQPLFKMF